MTAIKTKADAEALINQEGVEYVSVRFTDLIGVQQHFTVPASEFLKDAFDEGMPFDGSSVEGFQAINESDMKLVPDVETAYIDPFRKHKTLNVAFSIVDPLTDEPYSRDPRQVAAKAEAYLKATGIADTACFAPEAEFFLFDKVRFENSMQRSFYEVDSVEAPWNTGNDVEEDGTPNIGFKNRVKRGYFPVPPSDHYQDLRDDMVANLQKVGLILERAHHEVAGAGQQEINYRFNTLQHAGDDLMKFKYVIHETAFLAGKAATFMPKPIFGINGSGMHTNMSLFKDGKNAFYDPDDPKGLSREAYSFIAGLLAHVKGMAAVTNPLVNSYKRLVPGYEAPCYLAWSASNRSALIRIPASRGQGTRVELRSPDPACNPYLAFAVCLAAGLDGIEKGMTPPAEITENIYAMDDAARKAHGIESLPGSLEEALHALEDDQLILDALGEHVAANYLAGKWREWDEYRTRVSSWEREKYIINY